MVTKKQSTARKGMAAAIGSAIGGLVVFGSLAAFAQGADLSSVLVREGWVAAVAFVAGACTVLLPRMFPLFAMLLVFFLFAYLATLTAFVPIALMLMVVGGFWSGLGAYSIVFQLKGKGRPPLLRTGR